MPYTGKQERVFNALAHGWKPREGSLKKIGAAKAKAMLAEAKRAGQHKALKEA